MTPFEVAKAVIQALDSKKALEIKLLKTQDITILADYFVICTATSTTHIKTLSDEAAKQLEERGEPVPRVEGYRGGGWVLMDFGCVVVHLFTDEVRKFYDLERLWSDAEEIDISSILTE